MEAKSLTKKRRKYNKKIETLKEYLNEYYRDKYYSTLRYDNNIAISIFPFLSSIYKEYNEEFEKNPQRFKNKRSILYSEIAKRVVHILENNLAKTKQRIKEIDKELY